MKLPLDSYAYRLFWHLKRLFWRRGNSGPPPLIMRRKPCITYDPPENLSGTTKLEKVCAELELTARLTEFLPRKLNEKQWRTLLMMPTFKERYEQLVFLRKKEDARTKENAMKESIRGQKVAKCLRKQSEERKHDNRLLQHVNSDLLGNRDASLRCIRSLIMQETPRVAVDCRFLQMLTVRGRNLTMIQLRNLLANNRNQLVPWPIYFTNFPVGNKEIEIDRQRHLAMLDSDKAFTGELTSLSYLDLFPELKTKKKIVYLSPHAEERLETIDPEACYVIGGIVDLVREPRLPLKASLVTAEREGLPCKKLPVDATLMRGGHTLFTLTLVLQVLIDVYNSDGHWETAFKKHIPTRKLRSPNEKNRKTLSRFQDLLQRKHEILRIVEERTAHLQPKIRERN